MARADEVGAGIRIDRQCRLRRGRVEVADDGLPVLRGSGPISNEDALAGIDAERAQR